MRAVSERLGEARGVLELNPTHADIREALKRLTQRETGRNFLIGLGTKFYEHVFNGQIETLFQRGKGHTHPYQRRLLEQRCHCFHFIGHGIFQDDRGCLLLNIEDGGIDYAGEQQIAGLFRNHESMKLAVLNSCKDAEVSSSRSLVGMAPQLVKLGIPAVVAMRFDLVGEFFDRLPHGGRLIFQPVRFGDNLSKSHLSDRIDQFGDALVLTGRGGHHGHTQIPGQTSVVDFQTVAFRFVHQVETDDRPVGDL